MMRMTQKAPARRRPAVAVTPRSAVIQSDKEARVSGGFAALLESAAQAILAVTYWFDPAPHPGSNPDTVSFSGRGVGVKGRSSAGDKFVQAETIEKVGPDSGPISLAARIRGINPGSWVVTVHMLESAHPAREPRQQE